MRRFPYWLSVIKSSSRLFHFPLSENESLSNAFGQCVFRKVSTSDYKKEASSKSRDKLVPLQYFTNENKNSKTFLEAIHKYRERERFLRGHVEFIYSALKFMKEYGVHKDLEVYKSLLDVMPKGKMVAQNAIQEEFQHYPKHQDCALAVLCQMERYGVMPDTEMETMLVNTFGSKNSPILKLGRMMYWMPKFKNACPWPLPEKLPEDSKELALLAVTQISSIDPSSQVSLMQTDEVEDSIDKTWIVSSMSPAQVELIEKLPKSSPLKVEGPFNIYVRSERVCHFVLRADTQSTVKTPPKRSEVDDVSFIHLWMAEEGTKTSRKLLLKKSVHEQQDGCLLAICSTGTSSPDSVLSWIRILEKLHSGLSNRTVLFTQPSSPSGEIAVKI